MKLPPSTEKEKSLFWKMNLPSKKELLKKPQISKTAINMHFTSETTLEKVGSFSVKHKFPLEAFKISKEKWNSRNML